MKTFFDGIFIDSNNDDEEPEYPIKLDYYRTRKTEGNVEAKYGIEVVKTEFIQGKVNVESKRVENIAKTSEEVDEILTVLRNNKVTPIGVQDVMDEIFI